MGSISPTNAVATGKRLHPSTEAARFRCPLSDILSPAALCRNRFRTPITFGIIGSSRLPSFRADLERGAGVRFAALLVAPTWLGKFASGSPSQSVCGGSSSSLSLAVSIAMRLSASVRVRFGLNASSS